MSTVRSTFVVGQRTSSGAASVKGGILGGLLSRGRQGNVNESAALTEIGILSRKLVHGSMDAAHNANEQRGLVLSVVAMENQIRAAAALSLNNSQSAAAKTEEVVTAIDAGTETITETNRSMTEMAETVKAGTEMMADFVLRACSRISY